MAMKTEVRGGIAFDVELVRSGLATGEMKVTEAMLNPFGTVHAGALVWFADVVATVLAIGERDLAGPGGKGFPLAINLNAQLLSNRRDGVILAKAAFVKEGRRVSTVRTEVTDEAGKVLLELTSTHILSE